MTRQDFIKLCGASCLGLVGMTLLSESAMAAVNYVQQQDEEKENIITIDRNDFVKSEKKDKIKYRNYVVVKNEKMEYPIVVYRFDENDYSAVLMRCSHQGSELTVNGDILSCPAHGSEFDKNGIVLQGPAEESLKIFTVSSDENNIYIHTV